MVFKDGFFEEEEREGFLIDSMVKRIWGAEMEVLQVVIDLCKHHDIRYFADWGTLLGCVRHQGFIPWDDDIDISMLREDYNRFLKVAEELPEPYQLLHSATNGEKTYQAVVCNGKFISTDKERMERFHDCPYAVGIDIFPLDYVPRDKETAVLQREICYMIIAIIEGYCAIDMKEREEMLSTIEKICNIKIEKTKPILPQMYRLLDIVGQMCGKDEGDELMLCTSQSLKKGLRLKKEWYKQTVKLPFECMELEVPIGYCDVLREEYGDWKVPVKNAASHEYGAWRAQEKMLEEYLAKR